MIGLICRPVVMASYNISSALSDPFSANFSILLFLSLIKMMESTFRRLFRSKHVLDLFVVSLLNILPSSSCQTIYQTPTKFLSFQGVGPKLTQLGHRPKKLTKLVVSFFGLWISSTFGNKHMPPFSFVGLDSLCFSAQFFEWAHMMLDQSLNSKFKSSFF